MRATLVAMAAKKKKASVVLRLVSQAGTGYFYTIRKAIRANAEKYASEKHTCAAGAHHPKSTLSRLSHV